MQPITESLPGHARVWVYQANRELTDREVAVIQATLQQFAQTWESHGHPLAAGAEILHQRFVVLAVDQSAHAPSGCSIDKSVALLQQIGQQHFIDLFDRTQVAHRDQHGAIVTTPLPKLKAKVAAGEFGPDTLVFNTLVENVAHLRDQFEVPAARTWLARYFPQPQIV